MTERDQSRYLLEGRGRPIDLVVSAVWGGIGAAELTAVVQNFSSIAESINKLPIGEREVAQLFTYGSGPLLILAGLTGAIDYLRSKEMFSEKTDQLIQKIGEKALKYGVGLGFIGAGIGGCYFASDTMLTKDLPSRDIWDGINRMIIVGSVAFGSLAAFIGGLSSFAEDEKSS